MSDPDPVFTVELAQSEIEMILGAIESAESEYDSSMSDDERGEVDNWNASLGDLYQKLKSAIVR